MVSFRFHIRNLAWRNLNRWLAARRYYAANKDWLLSFYNRVLVCFPRWPLPWRNQTRGVLLRGMREPLQVRLGTSDWYVLEEVFLEKVYEPITRRQLGDVRTIIDLGANTGFTIRLWQMFYPDARIVAVEPDAENLEMCNHNALKNGAPQQVTLVNACAAGSTRSVFLDRSYGAWRFSISNVRAPGAEPLPALTLPQILESCAVDATVDLLKCNIEGSEEEVFADCSAWIGRVRNMAVELHHPYSVERFLEDVRRGGGHFDVYYRKPTKGNTEFVFLERKD